MLTLLYVLGGLAILIGLIGTVVPALPGGPLVLVGLIAIAWADGFNHVGLWPLVAIGLIAIASLALDLFATAYGTKKSGASGWALLGVGLGLIVGLFFGLPGLIVGPFVGAVIGEYYARRDLGQATRAGIGAWLGLVLAAVARLMAALLMLAIFAIAWFV